MGTTEMPKESECSLILEAENDPEEFKLGLGLHLLKNICLSVYLSKYKFICLYFYLYKYI